MDSSRQKILDKIKRLEKAKVNFLPDEPDWEQNALKPSGENLVVSFQEELEKVGGKFFYTSRMQLAPTLHEFLQKHSVKAIFPAFQQDEYGLGLDYIEKEQFEQVEAILTPCHFLVAQTGSVVASSDFGRKNLVFGPLHIVLANESQLVPTMDEAMKRINEMKDALPSQITFITGSSRTADIEKTLVMGAHGPVMLAVFMIKDE